MTEIRWTAEQAAAIAAEGNVLLAASAGTGKTTTVVAKILWLLGLEVGATADSDEPIPACPSEKRCALDQIAAITFTEKAAYDLKKKLRAAIEAGERAEELRWEIDNASIGTIHGFCRELLHQHALRLGIDPTFHVLDEREARIEQENVIREVIFAALEVPEEDVVDLVGRLTLRGFERREGALGLIRQAIRDLRWHGERYGAWRMGSELDADRLRDLAKHFAEDADGLVVKECCTLYRLATRALSRWEQHMMAENLRDFDSLILDTRALLTGPDAGAPLRAIRSRYRILIIDEFQDTDGAQKDIAFAIAGIGRSGATGREPGCPQLYLVGDPKQSIYRFRGAEISVWNSVRGELGGNGRLLDLTRNFRSQPEVIRFVNAVGHRALGEVARELEGARAGSQVAYSELIPAGPGSGTGAVEWLAAEGGSIDERRQTEAELVATRIRELVGSVDVRDPDARAPRKCKYSDIALLYRARTGREFYERALRRYGIPCYVTSPGGFHERQEVADLLNVLRLIDNPRDDLRAFGYLRSPFVGLRDEVIVRIRLEGGAGSLLEQAGQFLSRGEWYAAPEHPAIAEVERHSLAAGLEALERAAGLCWREPLDELLEDVIGSTGYRLHLMLMEDHQESLANVERFLRVLEEYRSRPLGTFLEIWDRWDHRDTGIPQAPLYSKEDNVVTISSMHSAKGLEWPVVFLIDTGDAREFSLTGTYWSDPELGPVVCPKQKDRGPRAEEIHRRYQLEERAEKARLLYVATTRARDRLVVCGPLHSDAGLAGWLGAGRHEDVWTRTMAPQLEMPMHDPVVELDWLDGIRRDEPPPLAESLSVPALRFGTSATELMAQDRRPEEWRLRYLHGVEPSWWFAASPVPEGAEALSPRERGTVIHGVLERIRDEEELSSLLDEVVSAVDASGVEALLAPGTRYRAALEEEIRHVVQSEAWQWYVDGEHYRELSFVRLLGPRRWVVGAFDLYRPARTSGVSQIALDFSGLDGGVVADRDTWIVDFKTHKIGAKECERTARDYELQARVYREAATALAGAGTTGEVPVEGAASAAGTVRIALHFTAPNVAVEM